jgi:hypothetical protein
MHTLLRRCLVVAALMFWQGGFTFYASVVVPLGQAILHPPTEQGFITRQVTNWLNLSGAVALLILAWDLLTTHDASARRRGGRWLTWTGMLFTLVLLLWFHRRLDAFLNPDEMRLLDRPAFRAEHRWYLWLSTVQWGCCLIYIVLTLRAWQHEDQAVRPSSLGVDQEAGEKRVGA